MRANEETDLEARGWIGVTVGSRYKVLELLGSGGMGTVFRARDTELEETVALKLLRRDLLAVPGIVERFRREVKLARRVTHRNVARVFDIGEHYGDKFLTMELVEGEPLADRLRRAPLPWDEGIRVSLAIAEGLAAAHAAGVVHRDLKPENVLLARDGRVVITDFGIARARFDQGDVLRTVGSAVGTPAYMAPEQIELERPIDARADVYAFGAVMFELFTGRRAWPGEAPIAVAAARLIHPPPDPLTVRPDMPAAYAQVIVRCLARSPDDRFASAEAVAVALRVPTPWFVEGNGASSLGYDLRTAPTIMDVDSQGSAANEMPFDPFELPSDRGIESSGVRVAISPPSVSVPSSNPGSDRISSVPRPPASLPAAHSTLPSPVPVGAMASPAPVASVVIAPPRSNGDAGSPPVSLGKPASSPPSSPKTVAVLPFRNIGGADDEYLADGLTDELIDTLSMTPGLRVRSRGVVMQHKGTDSDPREIGAKLDVGLVVEGSIRRTPAGVRITARVVAVRDGSQLWAKRFDKSTVDVFVVSEEVARAVAEALTLESAAPAREAPADPAAMDYYLRARQEYRKYWPENVKNSVGLFEEALARAPGNPTILSAYALACARMWWFGGSEGSRAEAKARDAAERANAAAPHLGEPHLALAQVFWNSGDAINTAREVVRAIARAPTLAEAHALRGRFLVEANELDAGIRSLRTAISLDPNVPLGANDMARALAFQQKWDEMSAVFDHIHKTEGELSLWFMRARLAMWRRDKVAAQAYLREVNPHERALSVTRWILEQVLATTPPLEAVDLSYFRTQVDASSRRRSFMLQIETEIRAFHNQLDAALSSLEKSVAAGLFDLAWLEGCPLLAPLRSHPRFAASRDIIAGRARAALAELS